MKITIYAPIFFDDKFFKSKLSIIKFVNRRSIITNRLLQFGQKVSIYSGKT